MPGLCYCVGAACLAYCIGILRRKAAGTRFFLIWFVLAALFALAGIFLQKGWMDRMSDGMKTASLTALFLAVALGLGGAGLILTGFGAKGERGLSWIIVLGAQLKENGPSLALKKRLDTAAEYLRENPETFCVVSGGRGYNEPMSEAEGMYAYLVSKGISPERIRREEKSRNTRQNLFFSRKLVPAGIEKAGIVTSDFHVYRSVRLAKNCGFPGAVGISAPSGLYFLPNNMLREILGIFKDLAEGNMKIL